MSSASIARPGDPGDRRREDLTRFVLDTSALLTLHNDEPGSDRVAGLLEAAADGKSEAYGCFMSLMEVFYRVWKSEGERAGRAAYSQCQALPLLWIDQSPALLERAARVKALYPLSLADAWIAATAIECDATLIHKDPEFAVIEGLLQEPLPMKQSAL